MRLIKIIKVWISGMLLVLYLSTLKHKTESREFHIKSGKQKRTGALTSTFCGHVDEYPFTLVDLHETTIPAMKCGRDYRIK